MDPTRHGPAKRAPNEGRGLDASAVLASPLPQALFVARRLHGANPAFRELFSPVLDELPRPTLLQLLGRPLAAAARELQRVAEEDGRPAYTIRAVEIAFPDGTARTFDLFGVRATLPEKTGLLLTVVDVTDSWTRIRDLQDKLHTLHALADTDAAPATVIRDNIVLWANRGYASLLGYPSTEEITGKEITRFVAPRDRQAAPGKLGADKLEGEEVAVFEYSALSAAGKPVRVEASTQRIEYEGAPAGLTFHRNVTGKLKSTEELRARLDEEQRLEKILAASRRELDPDAFNRVALESLLRLLGFEAGAAYGIADDSGTLSLQAVSGMPEPTVKQLSQQSLQEGVTGFVAKTLEPLHLLTASYPAHLPYGSLFQTAGFATVVYLPLTADEALRGIFLLCSTKTIDPTDLPPAFLTTIGRALGDGLENAIRFRALARSELSYRSLVESVPDLPYTTTPAGAYLLLAPQVERLLLYSAADFIRNPDLWRQCVHPDDRAIYSGRIGGQAEETPGGDLVYRMLPKGKAEYRWVRDAFRYRRDAEGNLLAVDGIVADVTEGGLAQSEATLRSVIDNMGDALIITDLQGKIGEVNREFTRITGYARNEVLGMMLPYPWLDEESMGDVVAWVSALREREDLRDFDMTWRRKDGHRLAISLNTTLLRNTARVPVAMLNIARNISERKALYTEVQARMAQISSLYELGEGLTGAIDRESILAHVAAKTARIVSYDRFVFASADQRSGLQVALASEGGENAGRRCEPDEHELQFLKQHGEDLLGGRTVTEAQGLSLAVPIRGKETNHGALLVLRSREPGYNDTDLRLLESIATLTGIALDRAHLYEDTLAKTAEIETRNRELDDFTYVVSHDLKEPLITIEGYSTVVTRDFAGRLDPEGAEYLRSIVAAAERMKRLIDDLLQLSRVSRAAADREPVPLQTVLDAVRHDLDYTLGERHAEIRVAGELPVVMYNPTQLGLVLRNLIANGIKFNRSDRPVVEIRVREESGEFVLSVSDNGIGIPPEYFDRVFVIFQRLHSAEEYPGTGAGLSIVKKIVERHRGRVWVESEEGKGTTFHVTIPK